jgi:hypothetical protein
MTDSPDRYVLPIDDRPIEYRAIGKTAIASVVLGLLSFLIVPTSLTSIDGYLVVVGLPIAGVFVGWIALLKIRRNPDQLTGGAVALVGVGLSLFFLIAGSAIATYVYQTEVPDGYERISFSTLRPDYEIGPELDVVGKLPPEILALDGERVFIKGYMRPPAFMSNIRDFLLVRDDNSCCFGPIDDVMYFDQVQVSLVGHLATDYDKRTYRTAGKLKIHEENVGKGTGYPVFTLEADYVK